jgi:thiosulfate/3-mercaptopyruvate sulfurtransferase
VSGAAIPSPLIRPEELARQIEMGDPPVIADVRWWLAGPPGREAYGAGHVPGAQYVDLEAELTGEHRADGAGGRHPLPDTGDFTALMRRIGVSSSTPVVVYDADTALAASRLWWLLVDAGHEDVRVLDGGYAGWTALGLPVESGPGWPVAAGSFEAHPGRLGTVDAATVLAAETAGEAFTLVDVRAGERYRGEVEPMDPVAGHIPGALNLPSMQNVDAAGRFLGPEALAERFTALPEAPVLYCGSGVTAAHTLLAMAVAGRADGVIYPGSWSDWVSDPARPVATGP